MTLEFPQAQEHDPNEDVGSVERRAEQQLEKKREGAVDASFVLLGASLATAGCDVDMNRIMIPEAQTEIITVAHAIEKKFDKGIISFQECPSFTESEANKEVDIGFSTLIVEDAEYIDDKGFKHYYGARFTKEHKRPEDVFIKVAFFADSQRFYEQPCTMQMSNVGEEEKDRYRMLVQNLNIRLNVYRALRHTLGAEPEAGAVRAHVQEFLEQLDQEFPGSYDKKLVEQVMKE